MIKFYEMYKIDAENEKLVPDLDYMMLAANSDLRCYKWLLTFSKMKKSKELLIFDYDKFKPKKSDQTVCMDCESICEEKDNTKCKNYYSYKNLTDYQLIECHNDDDDVLSINKLDIKPNNKIGIDITGFSIPDLFRIIYVLKEIKGIEDIHTFYSEPKQYAFKNGFFDDFELLKGERTNKAIPEYFVSGDQNNEILVFFLGFDKFVSKYVHDRIMPTDSVAINGFPSFMPKLKDISLLNNYELLSTIGVEKIYNTKASNPFDAYNTLCQIKSKYNDSLLNICVLGTKPMALGACIFAIKNKDSVKVTYPYPQEYNFSISLESANLWYYHVNFTDEVK